jgi:hypothetical protein
MSRPIAAAALLVLVSFVSLISAPPQAASPSATPLALADLAWDRGDYPAALSGYLRLLDSPDAASVLEPIALRTGELYTTTELTRDGASPQFSPDGRYILCEHGPAATRVTRLVATVEPGRAIAELKALERRSRQTAGRLCTGSRLPAGQRQRARC